MRSVANRLHRGSGRLPICRILPAKNPAHQSAAAPHVRQQSEMTADSQTLPPTGQNALVSGIRQPFFAPSRSWQCLPFRPHRGNAFFKRPAAFTGFASAFERSKILASDSLSAFPRRHSGFQVVYDICHLRYYCTPMSPDCQRFYGHMPKINFWSALCNSRPISSIYILCIQRAVEFLTEVAFNQGIFVL